MENCYHHEVSVRGANGQQIISRVPVVQELVRQGLRYLPERFVKEEMATQPCSNHIQLGGNEGPPIINMRNLSQEADSGCRTNELARLAKGAKEWGAFFITNFNFPLGLLGCLEDKVKRFFNLSFEEKKKSVGSYAGTDNLGYGRSFVKSNEQRLDWIDRLAMRVLPKDSTIGLNVWPKNPVDFRPVMEKYVEAARKVCDELLEALGEALHLEKQTFLRYMESTESVMNVRVNYYPPCPRPALALGLSNHSDGSAVTILAQFGAANGLEMFKDEKWQHISFPPQALMVLIGDLLEIMSNGRLESPWHRAVTHEDKERFSVALFYYPPLWAEIEPLQESVTGHGCYRKLTVKDYLEHYNGSYPSPEKITKKYA